MLKARLTLSLLECHVVCVSSGDEFARLVDAIRDNSVFKRIMRGRAIGNADTTWRTVHLYKGDTKWDRKLTIVDAPLELNSNDYGLRSICLAGLPNLKEDFLVLLCQHFLKDPPSIANRSGHIVLIDDKLNDEFFRQQKDAYNCTFCDALYQRKLPVLRENGERNDIIVD
ncbi:MAG: hypothetical protein KatS3mg087_1064 [Patescibacteria group bacterium]|nr:MAG: hypothetical protein KatS3mg087_1064 [Patescibacteria group bacterium]